MKCSDALGRLLTYQDELLTVIGRSTQMLDLPVDQAQPALSRARWELARLLRQYQLFKHTEIFDPFIVHDDTVKGETARLMKIRCLEMGAVFQEHVTRWSSRDSIGAWSEYVVAVRRILRRLVQHIERERRDIDRLLEGRDRIRAIPAQPHAR